jgi:L-threonylcarbamoyladenylate synthase
VETQLIAAADPEALSRALEVLRRGGLVAFPTDTVYGVGVSAFDPAGIEQLFTVKGRDTSKAIAVLLGDAADLPRVTAGMNPLAGRLAERFWPGPLTLVVSRHPGLPAALSPQPTIGVRMPDHPVALELLRRAGPLATTSANLSGQASPVTAQEVMDQLGGRIALVLDGGRTPGGLASTVVDCTGSAPVILRQGPLSLEELLAVL